MIIIISLPPRIPSSSRNSSTVIAIVIINITAVANLNLLRLIINHLPRGTRVDMPDCLARACDTTNALPTTPRCLILGLLCLRLSGCILESPPSTIETLDT
jgi:hypothetical protein